MKLNTQGFHHITFVAANDELTSSADFRRYTLQGSN